MPQQVPCPAKITSLSIGCDFGVFLADNGLVYTMGGNGFGELGVGDREPRAGLSLVRSLKDQNEIVTEVSCGFKHALCRTALNHLFVWGCNRMG